MFAIFRSPQSRRGARRRGLNGRGNERAEALVKDAKRKMTANRLRTGSGLRPGGDNIPVRSMTIILPC